MLCTTSTPKIVYTLYKFTVNLWSLKMQLLKILG